MCLFQWRWCFLPGLCRDSVKCWWVSRDLSRRPLPFSDAYLHHVGISPKAYRNTRLVLRPSIQMKKRKQTIKRKAFSIRVFESHFKNRIILYLIFFFLTKHQMEKFSELFFWKEFQFLKAHALKACNLLQPFYYCKHTTRLEAMDSLFIFLRLLTVQSSL